MITRANLHALRPGGVCGYITLSSVDCTAFCGIWQQCRVPPLRDDMRGDPWASAPQTSCGLRMHAGRRWPELRNPPHSASIAWPELSNPHDGAEHRLAPFDAMQPLGNTASSSALVASHYTHDLGRRGQSVSLSWSSLRSIGLIAWHVARYLSCTSTALPLTCC